MSKNHATLQTVTLQQFLFKWFFTGENVIGEVISSCGLFSRILRSETSNYNPRVSWIQERRAHRDVQIESGNLLCLEPTKVRLDSMLHLWTRCKWKIMAFFNLICPRQGPKLRMVGKQNSKSLLTSSSDQKMPSFTRFKKSVKRFGDF